MKPSFSPMHSPDSPPKAGAFNSDGFEIETPWHFHDLHQLLYAFEDSVEVVGPSARYKVPHQFAAWIPAGTAHRTSIQNVRSGSVFFTPEMIDSPSDEVRVIPAPNLMREMIMYAMRWPMGGEESSVRKVFFDCFAALCSEWIDQEMKLVLPSSEDPRINNIVNFTRANLATVTLPDVCKVVGMSPRTLRRHFQRDMGITWDEFRLRLRMYAAIDALDNTNKPIGVIAADVGYTSQAAFTKAFRTIMGIGPTAYRKAEQ